MPRQNRVTPMGEIVAVADRGTFMGNRGQLHDPEGKIRRDWQLSRWIICLLKFKNRKRRVMTPGHYTELFFLDEATAFAAGHRPCAECRRESFKRYREAIAAAVPVAVELPHSAIEIDAQLHAERIAADGSKRLHTANLDDLPDRVFVLIPGEENCPRLVIGRFLLTWSAGGYTERVERPRRQEVRVLTPELSIRAIRGGYFPEIHPTAQNWLDR
ncbi:MAG TPA: hypothetical protein VLM40_01200 [Gemmata sp.]|nr:hypothetical protein [Gemmata sp.]